MHPLEQPSSFSMLASSQVSSPSTEPLPHSLWQVAEQPSPSTWLPSSHVSMATSIRPLPQSSSSSHSSPTHASLPPSSPHAATVNSSPTTTNRTRRSVIYGGGR